MRRLIIFTSLLLFLFACKKSDNETIPNVPVNITLLLSLPQYSALNSIGNHVLISGGVRGIIVYRKSIDEFASYERACPYDPSASSSGPLLEVDSSGSVAFDANCGSRFILTDGSILNGPATLGMKPYTTVYDASQNVLYITN